MIWIIISIIVIFFLIFLSALFSSAEMAFVSINRAGVKEKAQEGDKHAIILDHLLQKPQNVISAIVIGNNLINIFASIIAGTVATILFGNIGIGVATVVMTILVIIFGESAPKSFGMRNIRFALRIARLLAFITKIFYPLVLLLTSISNGLIRLVGGTVKGRSIVTEKEIMAMMRLGEAEGTIATDEREMVKEVFEFDETKASEVYTPLDKIVFLQENNTIEQLIQKTIETGYSRFPIYRENLDDIIGMVHVKDTFVIKEKNTLLKSIMRPILKIETSMKVDDVLRMMKAKKTHLALLQTSEGKTKGLISMEDLIEEIFGEIADEHDIRRSRLDKKQ
jgi:putative hemolysin